MWTGVCAHVVRRYQLVNFDLGLKVCKVKEKETFLFIYFIFLFPVKLWKKKANS